MLSDEEKEALEILNNTEWDGFMITIKNLIEKQQKEIEELKEVKWYYEISRVPNDKIKAKIEELEKDFKEYENGQEWEIQDEIRGQIEVLQSLLEKE